MRSLMEMQKVVAELWRKYKRGWFDRGEVRGVYEEVFDGVLANIGSGEAHREWLKLEKKVEAISNLSTGYNPCPEYASNRCVDCWDCKSSTCDIKLLLVGLGTHRPNDPALNTHSTQRGDTPPKRFSSPPNDFFIDNIVGF